MDYRTSTRALIAAAALGLAACAMPPAQTTYPGGATYPSTGTYPSSGTYPQQAYTSYGYVESVEVVPASGSQGPGIGAVGGAIAGGVLGNQIGSGSGRTAATVGGAVAGGVIGHQIEKRVNPGNPAQYRYRVRMDDGSYQTFTQEADANVRAGDRVRVENGRVWPS